MKVLIVLAAVLAAPFASSLSASGVARPQDHARRDARGHHGTGAASPLPAAIPASLPAGSAESMAAADNKFPTDFIREAGYPAEEHYVTTSDGYVLRLERIARPGATPIVLAHTLFTSSFIFLFMGSQKSIGYLLYEAGFDVWLVNYRGTFLSLNHTSLSSSEDDYWKFGWQENGVLDNTATIDFVLAQTGRSRVVYFGHSLGSTTFFAMASERPDMLAKVEAAFLCAPPVFIAHTTDPTTKIGNFFGNVSQVLIEQLHFYELPEGFIRTLTQTFCSGRYPILDSICLMAAGLDHDFASLLPDMGLFFPGGGSAWQLLHFTQLADPKWPGFRKFNYGSAAANRAKYGTDSPPDFSLKHINTPLYLYNGPADTVVTRKDVNQLKDSLTNVKRFFFSPNENFGHRDFVMSLTAYEDVWQYMLADLVPYLRQ